MRSWTRSSRPTASFAPKAVPFAMSSSWAWVSRCSMRPRFIKRWTYCLSPQCFDLSPAHVPRLDGWHSRRDGPLRDAVPAIGDGAQLAQREAGAAGNASFRLARRYPLDVLRKAMEQVTSIQRRPLMVEYLLLDGLNDTDQDLHELIAYLRGLRVHINLIPYNSIREGPGLIGYDSGAAAVFRRGPNRRWFHSHRPLLTGGRHRRGLWPTRPTGNGCCCRAFLPRSQGVRYRKRG